MPGWPVLLKTRSKSRVHNKFPKGGRPHDWAGLLITPGSITAVSFNIVLFMKPAFNENGGAPLHDRKPKQLPSPDAFENQQNAEEKAQEVSAKTLSAY